MGRPVAGILAGMMAVGIVHALEIVDVEHDGRQLHASRCLPGDFLRAQEEFPAIEQTAERINGSVVYQLALADRQIRTMLAGASLTLAQQTQ